MVPKVIKPCSSQGCCTILEEDYQDDDAQMSDVISFISSNTTEIILSNNHDHHSLISSLTASVFQELCSTVYQLPTSLIRLVSDVWSHFNKEPKKPTWNIQTTVVMAFLQAFRDQSLTNSLEFWRLMLIAPTFLRPITSKTEPEYILIKKRKLCGILSPLDEEEKGTRRLEAEWMSAVTTWERIYGGPTTPHAYKNGPLMLEAPPSCEKIVFYIHGGAYCAMSAQTHRILTHKISKSTKRRVLGNISLLLLSMYTY
jgi:hypothetical protein